MVEVVYYPVGSSVASVFRGRLLRKTADEYVFRKAVGNKKIMLVLQKKNIVSINEIG